MVDPCQTVSPAKAGAVLGISRTLAYRLIHAGVIPALRLGKKLRVPKAALDELLRNPQRWSEEKEENE